ncbi:excisionase family DNA-binding protein [Terracidiphilus sp.]|jgi:excisionase family DNA binding protein|uniref:excisionase family DNA-binding protein n=1 Tax=Terracidiphilus sp. TaxID=1964191 RepID=UPI003C26B15A
MNIKSMPEWKANSASEWLTEAEAAQYLRVNLLTLFQWVRERKVPAHQLSGVRRCVWKFLRPELDAVLDPSARAAADRRQQ